MAYRKEGFADMQGVRSDGKTLSHWHARPGLPRYEYPSSDHHASIRGKISRDERAVIGKNGREPKRVGSDRRVSR